MQQLAHATRNTEALLSAAGCAPPSWSIPAPDADILLKRVDEDQWDVIVMTPRARRWACEEQCRAFCQCGGDRMRLDIVRVRRLLEMAHDRGFKSEFVGQSGRDYS